MENNRAFKYIHRTLVVLWLLCGIIVVSVKDHNYHKEFQNYDTYEQNWTLEDGTALTFPYVPTGTFAIQTDLEDAYYDDRLIIWNLRYDEVKAYVDEELVFQTEEYSKFGINTNAGMNMLLIPLREEYSGKKLRLEITPRDSLYSIQLTSVSIKTEDEFIIEKIRENMWTFIVAVVLIASGIIYMFIGLIYLKMSRDKEQNRHAVIILAGLFSILIGLWTVFDSRVLGLLTRNVVANALATYLLFDVMGVPFVAMMKALLGGRVKAVNVLYYASMILPIVQIVIFITGIMDVTESLIFTQILFGVGLVIIAFYAIKGMPKTLTRKERIITRTGSASFAIFGSIALVIYAFDRNGPYKSFVLIAVFLYILTQVFLVIAKMQLADEEQKELVQNREYAYSDSLTKLSNARAYAEELELLRKNPLSERLSIIFIDINRLKFYNDTMGHDIGDKLIVGAADCIRDSFDKAILTSRRGGDEFVVITDIEAAELDKCILKLNDAINEWNQHERVVLSVSLGGASVWDNPGCDVEKLCEIADLNMYKDKEKFYNRTGYDRRR